MIISQTKNPFLGVVFDEDHDFEGLSAPKAHLDPVLANVTNVLEQGSSSKLVSLYFKLYEFFLTRQSAAALSLKLRGRGALCRISLQFGTLASMVLSHITFKHPVFCTHPFCSSSAAP